MKTYQHKELSPHLARSHPWTTAVDNPDDRYYDLKADLALIPRVLEDFRPWAHYDAVRSFYALLKWLNGADSPFESNDCAFSGPGPNNTPSIAKPLECSGRLMILYRDLASNLSRGLIDRLENGMHFHLETLEPDLEWGAVGTTRVEVEYRAFPPGEGHGHQLSLSFWAWGDDEEEAMKNLWRIFSAIDECLRMLAKDVAGPELRRAN